MISREELNPSVTNLGACMADLVAGVYALVTERESGSLLTQRVREIKATLSAISRHVDSIGALRGSDEAEATALETDRLDDRCPHCNVFRWQENQSAEGYVCAGGRKSHAFTSRRQGVK